MYYNLESLCQFPNSSDLTKHSYLSLTQFGHACQRSPKNTRENLAVTEVCQSSVALVYFILDNFISKLMKALIQVVIWL